jgi:hypothetical protein
MKSTDLLNEARSINATLIQSKESLIHSVEQTETARDMIKMDENIINSALHTHKYELKTTLQSTKKRLARIKSAEKYEKLAINASIGFFFMIVIYILLVRFRVFDLIYYFFACKSSSNGPDEL